MSALNEVYKSVIIPESVKEQTKAFINKLFWEWFHQNYNRKLTTIKFWIISKSIYVRDLRDIFTILFGPENGISEGSVS